MPQSHPVLTGKMLRKVYRYFASFPFHAEIYNKSEEEDADEFIEEILKELGI